MIKIILQFCKENALTDSFNVIQVRYVPKQKQAAKQGPVLISYLPHAAERMPGLSEHSGELGDIPSRYQQRKMGPSASSSCTAEATPGQGGRPVRRGMLLHHKFATLEMHLSLKQGHAKLRQSCPATEALLFSPSKHPYVDQEVNSFLKVVLEMIELRETDTARAMLRQTAIFQRMRVDDPDRLLRLERLCNQTYFDIR